LKNASIQLALTIENGGSLSDGISLSPRVFDTLYVNLVRAGEVSGRLPATLHRLYQHIERSILLRRDLLSALAYPMCVISTAAAVSSLLLVFIIPAFKDFFAEFDAPLPLLTRIVISLSEMSVRCLPWVFVIVSVICFMISRFIITPRGRAIADNFLLQIPVWGELVTMTALTRSCRTLATSLDAGVPILQALDVSADAAGNVRIRQEFMNIRRDVAEGSSISHSLLTSKLFPSLTVEMLDIGERTGCLDTMLENVAAHFEDECQQRIGLLKRVVEPSLIVILGAVIGTLVLAMYLPIFSMGEMLG
jgi:type IV pilus assembly protein PilC